MAAPRVLARSHVPGLTKVLEGVGWGRAEPRAAASGIGFSVLEGLHLTRRLAKEHDRRRPHLTGKLSGAARSGRGR